MQQVYKDIVALAVGDDNGNSLIGHFTGNIGFGEHASASETGFGSLYVRGQVFAVLYLTDDFRCRVGRRAVVDAVDVAEDNQDLRIHHGSYQSGELVIIGEHQFADGNGIVLVDNGNHSVFQHYGHAVFLVEIVAAGSEVLFHGEHLPHRDAVFTE